MTEIKEKASVEERINKILLKIGQRDPGPKGTWLLSMAEIVPEADLVNDLGFDSLKLLDMFDELEEEFDLDIPDNERLIIRTVQDLYDYIDV